MGFNLKSLKSQAINQLKGGILGKVNDNIPGNIGYGKDGFSYSGNFRQLIDKRQRRWRSSGPLGALYQSNGGKYNAPLQFPLDLDDEHYMTFHVMDRRRPSKETVEKESSIISITLPIPSNLTNNHGVSYNNDNLNVLGKVAAGKISMDELGKGYTDVQAKILERAKGFLKTGNQTDETELTKAQGISIVSTVAVTAALSKIPSLGGALAGLGGLGGASQIISGIGLAEGVAINPHTAVLFDNVNFREFGFSYKFIARNEQESEAIKGIINTFEKAMHPSVGFGGGVFFEYPEEFDIEFSSKIKRHLFNVNRSVLKSISVNYNGENIPIFFEETGAPVSIEVSLQFQETKILTKEDFGGKDWSGQIDDYEYDNFTDFSGNVIK
jgi:hypothetical protein